MATSLPVRIWLPEVVPAVAPKVRPVRIMLPAGFVRLTFKIVKAPPARNETLYGVPLEQITLSVDVEVSVPRTLLIFPKFIAVALTRQAFTMLIRTLKFLERVAAFT